MALIVGGTTVTGTQTLDATKLTGNLPEISGADLTNLPAPSASDIGTGTASIAFDAVGSYAALCYSSSGAGFSGGSTTAGSGLDTVTFAGNDGGSNRSGTWRCMGHTINSSSDHSRGTVWLRIS